MKISQPTSEYERDNILTIKALDLGKVVEGEADLALGSLAIARRQVTIGKVPQSSQEYTMFFF